MFSERLKRILELLGVSCADVARFAGCDPSNISRMTSGARVPKNGGTAARKLVNGIYLWADDRGKADVLCKVISCDRSKFADEVKTSLMTWLFDGAEEAPKTTEPPKEKIPFRVFGEKLDAVMNLTELSNVRLGRMMNLDPSYISRFRSGFRSPKANPKIMTNMCSVLLDRVYEQEKIPELIKITDLSPTPFSDRDTALDAFYGWLFNTEKNDAALIVEGLIDRLGSFSGGVRMPVLSLEKAADDEIVNEKDSSYYGEEGLKRSVIRFLGNAVRRGEKELFLYSDQNMDWMVSDPEFRAKWASLMILCVTGGTKINIIHNVNRDLSEMTDAIQSWIPLYPSGMIHSYYSKASAGTRFSTTLFLCPGYACISGVNVIGTEKESGLYRFDTAPEQLKAHEAAYRALLANSGELVHVYKTRDVYSLNSQKLTSLSGFGSTLSLATMPDSTFSSALERGGFDEKTKEFLISARFERAEQMKRSMKKGFLHEYLPLPTDEELFDGNVPMDLPTCSLTYTPKEYTEHIRNVIAIMEANTNYRLILIPEAPFENLDILIADDFVALGRLKEPFYTIVFEHPDLCRAFAAYAERIKEQYKQDKLTVKKTLERFL